MLVYVDDLFITGDHEKEMEELKVALENEFTIKDLGELRYFVGIEVARNLVEPC